MRLATMVAAAFALAATIGSASGADQLKTLNGVKAVPMSAGELSTIKGMAHHFSIRTAGSSPNVTSTGLLDPPASASAQPLAAPQAGRFGTDFNQDADESNFVDITPTQNAAPSYLGFQNASCNGVIVVPTFATCL